MPSVELLPVLDVLTPDMLEVDGQIDALVAVQRHIALLQARETELLAALDASDTSKDGFTRDMVAAAVRVPPGRMRGQMAIASDLVGRLPATLDLLRSGQISARHATELVDATRSLTPETAAVVEARVLERAPEQTVTQFRASVKRAVLRVASPRPRKTRPTLMRWRSGGWSSPRSSTAWPNYGPTSPPSRPPPSPPPSTPSPTPPSTARVGTRAPATNAAPTRSSTCAPPPWATRTSPAGTGNDPAVQVTIAATTLMGLDDQPGELDGYGTITATMARHIATDPTATWRRLLTDDEVGCCTPGPPPTDPPPT